MKIISDISDTIDRLLNAAEEHIEYAHKIKEQDPIVAQLYCTTSGNEMTMVTAFHEQIVRLIEDYRKAHGEPPERMMGRYEYIHEKHIEQANKIRILQGLFK